MFSNSTRLSFNTKRISVLIQTDKAFYKPKQEVKFRVLTLLSDFKPYKTPVNIFIKVSGRQKGRISSHSAQAVLRVLLMLLAQ